MSHVYRATDTLIGRTVAVKILTDAGCQDPDVKDRFVAEARMAGSLTHDNVLGIYDFGEDDRQRPFMVMEFLRGEDLRHALRNNSTGDLRNKLKIAAQVARALGYVHTQKIIHRDLKPENIHINTAGVVKLIDFGIAKTEGLQMTRAGYVLGTPYYMAPEQVRGENITEQVDVYAFGVLLFELLTGRKPVQGDAVERIFYSILNEPLQLDWLYEAGVPTGVCDLVRRCTAKNPAERPQGFGAVSRELELAAAELDAPTIALPAMPAGAKAAERISRAASVPAARPAWLMPAILMVVLALGAGFYFATRSRPGVAAGKSEAPTALARTLESKGGTMQLVEAGDFLIGEKKAHDTLPAFYIDRTEVSNGAYKQFCDETRHALPKGFVADQPDLPVVNILISDARAFAQWAGKRLPSGREWEKAARGVDGRLYPWGNTPNRLLANIGGAKAPISVGSMANGASPCGALNMLGNVWEIVDMPTTPGTGALETFTAEFAKLKLAPPTAQERWFMMRGMSFEDDEINPDGLWDASSVPERGFGLNIGFRCARDAAPDPSRER